MATEKPFRSYGVAGKESLTTVPVTSGAFDADGVKSTIGILSPTAFQKYDAVAYPAGITPKKFTSNHYFTPGASIPYDGTQKPFQRPENTESVSDPDTLTTETDWVFPTNSSTKDIMVANRALKRVTAKVVVNVLNEYWDHANTATDIASAAVIAECGVWATPPFNVMSRYGPNIEGNGVLAELLPNAYKAQATDRVVFEVEFYDIPKGGAIMLGASIFYNGLGAPSKAAAGAWHIDSISLEVQEK